jgi:hypothetical protein
MSDATGPSGPSAERREYRVVDRDGNARLYESDDFDEIFETDDEPEMRRHAGLGWLLLDQSTRREGGKKDWIGQTMRMFAGRKLGPGEDPSYVAPTDSVTYTLGHLKDGSIGTPVA